MNNLNPNQFNYSFSFEPSKEEGYSHGVFATHIPTGKKVGNLYWSAEDNTIQNMSVDREHRRKGVATQMWNFAKQQGVPGPEHSKFRSNLGNAWAQKIGGELPQRNKSFHYQE